MKNELAYVKNVTAVQDAFGSLNNREMNLPGLGLISGETGFGKTFTSVRMMTQFRAIFVRAWATWTPSSMLGAIARELGGEQTRSVQPMIDFIIKEMVMQNRPLFIDEVNHLDGDERQMHLIRDIHDTTGIPVVMISEEKTPRKLMRYPQIVNRIYEHVEFMPLDLEDVETLARTICEVEIGEGVLAKLLRDTEGNMRMITDGLAKLERHAQANGTGRVTLQAWGSKKFIFGQN